MRKIVKIHTDSEMNKEIFHKHLLLVAFRHSGRPFTNAEAVDMRFKYLNRRLIDSSSKIFVSGNEIGSSVLIFDVYVVKELSFFKRCRHYLRMFKTTVLGYVNISAVIKIITSD